MRRSYSRREFVAHCMKWSALSVSAGITAACSRGKTTGENREVVESCDDYSGVSEAELEKRRKLAYIIQAPDPEKQCNACKLYLPPKPGEKCGGCMLFKGPVESNGSCTYWAPLDQAG